MKKKVIPLTMFVFLYFNTSCNNPDTSIQKDSTLSVIDNTTESSTESIFIGKFKILEDHPSKIDLIKLEKLKKNLDVSDQRNSEGRIQDKGTNPTEKLIIELVGSANVTPIKIRYDASDEDRYCKIHNLSRTPDPKKDPCKVAYYTNEILQVQIKKVNHAKKGMETAPVYYYYDVYTIKPPPPDSK